VAKQGFHQKKYFGDGSSQVMKAKTVQTIYQVGACGDYNKTLCLLKILGTFATFDMGNFYCTKNTPSVRSIRHMTWWSVSAG
jgi:hypothetical protein